MPVDFKSVFQDRRTVILSAVLCCLLWGSAFPAIKAGYQLLSIARDDVPSQLVFAGWRFVLAGVLLLGFAALTRRRVFDFTPRQGGQLLALGLVLGEQVLEWKNAAALVLVCAGIWLGTRSVSRAQASVTLKHHPHAVEARRS